MTYPEQPAMNASKRLSSPTVFSIALPTWGTCIIACFCPCVTYGQNQQRAENKEGCFMDAAMYCIASSCGFQSCIGCMGRGHVRAVSNITNDSSVADCLTHLCCSPCALTQEKRELDIIGK
ncbi:hypothetical protein BASA62_008488 [Batrachochytrium salamandrivorans]|nr:hypothetical protein BASA62_008488 [Batrachochytrium salamandrivorans]